MVDGRGTRHLRVGGVAIDAAVTAAFLAALEPVALQACLQAARQLEHGHDAALAQHRRQVEQARYQAARAERRYQAVDPDNRLVARGLEAAWEKALTELAAAEAELARRQAARPATLTAAERAAILALGDDLQAVWDAPTTTDKDRKQLLRTLLDEVNITVHRDHDRGHADLVLRWKGGAITELTIPLKRTPPRRLRTDEDTISLIRRLAVHYPDAKIAGILNRQHRTTARGMSYTASRVQSLRHHWNIPCHQPGDDPQEGELLTVADAAAELGLAPSTLHRWLNDGFIAGEQLTPGAPWRIRLTPDIRALFVDDAPDGWLAMLEATLAYGVSRQTMMQRVKDAASSAPSTSAPDAGKACVSNPQHPKTGCSDHHNQQRSSVTMHPRTSGCRDRSPSRTSSSAGGMPPPRPAPTARDDSRRSPDGRSAPTLVLQHPGHHRLRDPVRDGRHAEHPGARRHAASVSPPPSPGREVRARGHPIPDPVQIVLQILLELRHATARPPRVRPCSPSPSPTPPRPPASRSRTACPVLSARPRDSSRASPG